MPTARRAARAASEGESWRICAGNAVPVRAHARSVSVRSATAETVAGSAPSLARRRAPAVVSFAGQRLRFVGIERHQRRAA